MVELLCLLRLSLLLAQDTGACRQGLEWCCRGPAGSGPISAGASIMGAK